MNRIYTINFFFEQKAIFLRNFASFFLKLLLELLEII